MGKLEAIEFDSCLTIRELKELLRNWQEEDIYGEPTEVWMTTGTSLSSPVMRVTPLNKIGASADLLFESSIYWEEDN